MIASFLLTIEMALQFRIHIFFSKQFKQPLDTLLRVLGAPAVYRVRNWSIESAGQTDQTGGMSRQLFRRDHTLARLCVFGYTQFHQRDQATEILITGTVAD